MESDDADCHHVIPRHSKPKADEEPPDPGPNDHGEPDDHNDPDDLPNLPRFTPPRSKAQSPTREQTSPSDHPVPDLPLVADQPAERGKA